ncbi:unnamed protein product, partial [Sphacelaria rigidula]
LCSISGKLIGLSGIFDGAFSAAKGRAWKVMFLSGFTAGGIAAGIMYPEGVSQLGAPALSATGFVVSGFLVGLGTRLGSGCTSGHGLCGLPRLSRRSIIATLTFLTSGVATASVMAAWSASGPARLNPTEAPSVMVRGVALATAVAGVVLTMAKNRAERAQWRAHLASMLCGANFAGGLVLSGMVKRAKVADFLAFR